MRWKMRTYSPCKKSGFLLFLLYERFQSAITAQVSHYLDQNQLCLGEKTAGQGPVFVLEFINVSIAGQNLAITVALL